MGTRLLLKGIFSSCIHIQSTCTSKHRSCLQAVLIQAQVMLASSFNAIPHTTPRIKLLIRISHEHCLPRTPDQLHYHGCMSVYECVWVCMSVYECLWVCMSVYACSQRVDQILLGDTESVVNLYNTLSAVAVWAALQLWAPTLVLFVSPETCMDLHLVLRRTQRSHIFWRRSCTPTAHAWLPY